MFLTKSFARVGCLLAAICLPPAARLAAQELGDETDVNLGTVAPAEGRASAQGQPYRWRQSDTSVALLHGDQPLWQYNYGPRLYKPYVHPLAIPGGPVLTWDQPPDHVWHHGLWFSWKFINGVNYWEASGQTGQPDGRTTWSGVKCVRKEDGTATVTMDVRYAAASDPAAVLSEHRRIDFTSPGSDGTYTIDWSASFTALQDATLDRTPPQPGSPGGYAGLSVRFAAGFEQREAISLARPLTFDRGDRHRSRSGAIDYSGLIDGAAAGLAFLDCTQNPRYPTPWYLIRSPQMSYINAALLAEEPLALSAGEQVTLRYRLIVHRGRWDAERLQAAFDNFNDRATQPAQK